MEKRIVNVKVKSIKDRVISFLASPNTIDRDYEILTPEGWELDNFKANPVFLWSHDRWSLPIGKGVNVYTDSNGLNLDVEFPTKDIYEVGDTVFKLYKNGYLNAVSVGFRTLERDPNNEMIITKKELYELSAVTVPANQDALQKALKDNVISEVEFKSCHLDGTCNTKEQTIEERLNSLEMKLKGLSEKIEGTVDAGKPDVSEAVTNLSNLIDTLKQINTNEVK